MAEWDITPSRPLATAYIHPKPKGGSCRGRVYVPDEEGGCSRAALLGDAHQPRPERNRARELIAGEIISVIRAYVGANGA